MSIPRYLRTKIIPPQPSIRMLPRPRITQALTEALHYRLTILQAGAGYGKSTALAVLANELKRVIWYQVTEEDSDPLVFMLHLCHATRLALPEIEESSLPLTLLEAWDGSRGPLPSAGITDQYINALSTHLTLPAFLVFDDIQTIASAPEIAFILDRLVGLAPSDLHILLAGRPPLILPNLARWRAQGDVLVLDQGLLAFDSHEIFTLFTQHYRYDLTTDEAEFLLKMSEGWAIALQLVWQSLRTGASSSVDDFFAHPANSLDSLFDILAREVFAGQPEDVQEFLRVSAVLRVLTSDACDALWNHAERQSALPPTGSGSAAMLAYLRRQELFVFDLGEGSLRYHNIFHNFLLQQSPVEQRCSWHRRAAEYYQQHGDYSSAIYHLLQGEDLNRAASLLDTFGSVLLTAGRLDSLAHTLSAFPPEVLRQHPPLLYYLGDLARLHSRFQEALGWYQQAETVWREHGQREGIGRALRGQARVYLDTVNPSRAEELLEQATRLSDGFDDRESRARLYELLAENKLNAGQAEEAERLSRQAEALRSEGPSDYQLKLRVLLRTGRLEEARREMEVRAETERAQPVTTPRAHRETLLLLSLVYSFLGEASLAYQAAQEGTRRGIDLDSPFITAVGHMRQGHALLLSCHEGEPHTGQGETSPSNRSDCYAQAKAQFEKTLELSRTLAVPRLRVEASWGLCRVYGFQGDIQAAIQAAQEGLEIGSQAGDEWISSLVRLAVGASMVLAERYEAAEEWLSRAAFGFQECSDPFGRSAARLWQCLAWFNRRSDDPQEAAIRLESLLPEVLSTCRKRGYDFLFLRPSIVSPPDNRRLVPLLLYARQLNWETSYVNRLLEGMGLPEIVLHPGYQLRVYALGCFHLWRGDRQAPPNSWRREKARQLFQIFLTYRTTLLERDQIIDMLWPGLDPVSAQRNFKVTLNTLYQAIEPNRSPGQESAYIFREETLYGLRPEADIWIDAGAFLTYVQQGEALVESDPKAAGRAFEAAINLYRGEYLPDSRYETWAAAEREHLAVQFLRAADRLTEIWVQEGRLADAINLSQRILAQDNCWERAYRHLMQAFDQLGDHGQVARTYQRCVQALRNELEVTPSIETERLYQELVADL